MSKKTYLSDSMDILLGAGPRKRNEAKESKEDSDAPLELMSKFLILVANRDMKEALEVCKELLVYEPNNKMLLDYRASIAAFIAQGLDEVEEEPSEEEKEEEDYDEEEGEGKSGSEEEDD